MKNNPLLDSEFLHKIDNHRNRVTYARITSLTNDQYPIDRIEGVVTAGSITVDGDSAVRRVCNLTLTTGEFNINNVYWGLTTRVKIEIGLENNINPLYENIIWFPQGVYILTDFKTSAQVNNYSITLQGKDKMCLLNGDIGGVFNAETLFDTERVLQTDGTWVDEKKSIVYIIREMVHHYAQENFHNIIIKDIDTLSLKVLRNNKTTFYLIKNMKTEEIQNVFYNDISISGESEYKYYDYPNVPVNFKSLLPSFIFDVNVDEDDSALSPYYITYQKPSIIFDEDNNKYTVVKIEPGEDIGYLLVETYYPDELIAGVGETVTSILDKIINTFGAFEYFYNIDGQFVFLAKETYVNTAWNNLITIDNETYVAPALVSSKVKYMFDSGVLTTAYLNAPKLGSIKNDYTVWGKKKLSSGVEIPIHMRYAIDKKPEYYHSYVSDDNSKEIIFITTEFYTKYIVPKYGEQDDKENSIIIENDIYSIVDWREIIYQMAKDYYRHNHDDDFEVLIYRHNKDKNFDVLYYENGKTGYEQYYHDIEGFWRLIYAPKDWLDAYNIDTAKIPTLIVDKANFYINDEYVGPWNHSITEDPSALIFWIDFFDAENLGLGLLSIPAIGDRPKNESNDNIRALIYRDIPDVVFVDNKELTKYYEDNRLLDGYAYITNILPDGCDKSNITALPKAYDFINECLETDTIYLSTRSVTAQEKIDDLLYNYGYCNETITITSVPIYYLEPNTIISAKDEARMINGYYIINKITLPLDYKGTMLITAIKVPERVLK